MRNYIFIIFLLLFGISSAQNYLKDRADIIKRGHIADGANDSTKIAQQAINPAYHFSINNADSGDIVRFDGTSWSYEAISSLNSSQFDAATLASITKYYADTAAMIAETSTGIKQYFLTELTSGSGVGGGKFVYKSSGFTANGVTVFAHATSGYIVREDWLKNKRIVDVTWGGFSSNNSATLNSAIMDACEDIARADSGGIYIPGGVYNFQEGINLDWHGASLWGDGMDKTILKRSSTLTSTSLISRSDYSEGSIKDLTIDAGFFEGAGRTGNGNPIYVDGVTNFLVSNVRVKDISGHTYGIWIRDSHSVDVEECKINGDTDGSQSPVGYTDDQEGIEVSQGACTNIKIRNNEIYNISGGGIYLYAGDDDGYTTSCEVYENNIYDISGAGIKLADIYEPDPIGLSFIQIYKNKITNATTGLLASTGATSRAYNGITCTDIVVEDNAFRNCGQSINTDFVTNFRFLNNKIYSDSATGQDFSSPFLLTNTYSTLIQDNKIFDSAGHGIGLTASAYNIMIEGNYIEGSVLGGIHINTNHQAVALNNTIVNCNAGLVSGGSSVLYSAIGIKNTDSVTVVKNNIIDTRTEKGHRFGIYVEGYANNSTIKENYIATTALQQDTANYAIVFADTTFHGNTYGVVTPAAGTTVTRVRFSRYSSTDAKIIVQIYGADINPTLGTGYNDGWNINHNSAVGDEKIYFESKP